MGTKSGRNDWATNTFCSIERLQSNYAGFDASTLISVRISSRERNWCAKNVAFFDEISQNADKVRSIWGAEARNLFPFTPSQSPVPVGLVPCWTPNSGTSDSSNAPAAEVDSAGFVSDVEGVVLLPASGFGDGEIAAPLSCTSGGTSITGTG